MQIKVGILTTTSMLCANIKLLITNIPIPFHNTSVHFFTKNFELENTVESHINESHIKDKSHINDVQAAYQLLL